MTPEALEQEIITIKNRNQKVELDKAWELSFTRKISIALLTYTVIVIFFYVAGFQSPFVNAFIPTIGFILSTLSLSFIKNVWIKISNKK